MQPFTVICTSDFNLYNRWFSGEDISPVLQQRQDLGFNSVRVWTAFDIPLIGRCDPFRPDFYARIPEFMDECASYALYIEWTAFTGMFPFWHADQPLPMLEHWNRLDAVIGNHSALLDLEAVNEGDNGPNVGVPLDRLHRPVGKLASHGSAIQDAPPMQPHWDVAGYRATPSEWWRKTGHNAMEWADTWNIPAWTNEYPRTDHDPDPIHWYDAAAASVLLCAGAGCFHSPEGKNSTLFTGQTLVCAQAFTMGARSVPLKYQQGAYSRPEPNPEGILRRYRRTLPNGDFKEVPVRE